jgi:hypothetical protein
VDARVFGDSWRLQKYCPETPSDYIVRKKKTHKKFDEWKLFLPLE